MGIPFRELVEKHCGGIRGGWDNLLAVIPGGSSVPCVPGTVCDELTMDFDTLQQAKSGLGTAAIIVMDKSSDIIAAIRRLSYFYKHESCGQCTPCRVGTEKAVELMSRDAWDGDLLRELSAAMASASICGLGQAAPNPLLCLLKYFPEELS